MAIDCCDNSGGRVALRINGVTYSARTQVVIRPTTIDREAKANQDGTLAITTKPVPAEADITLSDRCGLNLDALVNNCHVDATIEIIDMNRTYLFTKATVVGRPEIDSESGEIKNLKIVSALVRQIDNA